MDHDMVNEGTTPQEVLTPDEYLTAQYDSDGDRWDELLFTEPELEWLSLTDKERQQQINIERLRQQLAVYEAHPELTPYITTVMTGPGYLELPPVDRERFPDPDERYAEEARIKVKAQARALRRAGFTIDKDLDDDGDLTIRASRPDLDFRIHAYAGGYCKYVDTGLKERVEVIEVPEEIQKAYTRTVLEPKKQRVCAPLMTDAEVEAV